MIIWFVLNTHVKKLFSLKVFSHNKLLFHFTNDTDEWQNWYLWSIFYFEWHYGSMKFGPFFVGGTLFSCYVIGCIYTVNLKWSFSRLIISKKKKKIKSVPAKKLIFASLFEDMACGGYFHSRLSQEAEFFTNTINTQH